MGKPTGFLDYGREDVPHREVAQRIQDYNDMDVALPEETLRNQAARCMDCGVPFCHGSGCPLGNRIPEFNDYVYQGRWEQACAILHSTNNFPEVTGRICPAPCETSCTLNIAHDPVLIRHIESQIVERGFAEGWIQPVVAAEKTGKRVAIIGSGPAGLAAAQQLARVGHDVVVFEKDKHIGGLLRYGIPDFKLEKKLIDRRLEQMKAEGVRFETGVEVGEDISSRYLQRTFDAVCLTMGSMIPRDLMVEGRDLEGVHFAMEFLRQQNKRVSGEKFDEEPILAGGKHVIVIGGGDTGSDCVGTSIRQGAADVKQFEILPQPPEKRTDDNMWPEWPLVFRTSTSQEEGCERRWCVLTKKLTGDRNAQVRELHGIEVEWKKTDKKGWQMKELAGNGFTVKADLVLLAMGFIHVEHEGLVEQFGLEKDGRGNLITDNFATSQEGVFAAGDAVSGASLVVRAIRAGRDAAVAVNEYLKSQS